MSQSWSGGSTRRWRKLRQRVLDANAITNGGRCTAAIPGVCTGIANVVHHSLGRRVTGDDPRFLQAVCAKCNGAIGEPGQDPQPRQTTLW